MMEGRICSSACIRISSIINPWYRYLLLALLLASPISVTASTELREGTLQIEADRLAAVFSIVLKKARKSLVNTARDRDSGQWVVSYATPIDHDSEPVALLYYNKVIDVFQRHLDLLRRDDGVRRLAASADGRIIWDSEIQIVTSSDEQQSSDVMDLPLLALAGLTLSDVIAHVDGRVPIQDASGNGLSVAYAVVNDWYLLRVLSAATPPSAALPRLSATLPSAY